MSDTLRILYFTRDHTTHDHRFLSALSGTQHEIFSLRLEAKERQLEDCPLPEGIQQVAWAGGRQPAKFRDGLSLLRSLKRVIREVQPDLVHAGPVQKSAFLTALSGFSPLVSMTWGSDMLVDADRNPLWRWATRYTLNHSSVLVGDCDAVRQKAVNFGLSADRVVTFPWGIDLDQFTPGEGLAFRQQLGWQDCFVLLSVRSWEPIYGVDVLVQAFAQAAQELPDLRLLMLGGGSQEGLLRGYLQEARVLDRVHFVGQVANRDLPAIYQASDLYISASHSDGSSVSLMEALGCGRPSLLSDIPGNLEWVTYGKEGWLFPDGDIDALAAGIQKAVQAGENSLRMKKAARELAEKRADWGENFKMLLTAYDMAIDNVKIHP